MSTTAATSLPLTPMQLGMLYHHLRDEQRGLDVLQIVVDLREDVDAGRLRNAWQTVVGRHEMLRAGLERDGGQRASWIFHDSPTVDLQVHDWTGTSESELEARFEAFLQDDRARGFQLDRPPLTRVTLLQFRDERFRCVWTVPHIVLDAGSFVHVLDEVWRVYHALGEGVDAPMRPVRPYSEYLLWSAQHEVDGAQDFWRPLLEGYTTPIDVAAGGSVDGGTLELRRELPAGLTARLSEVAAANNVRLSTMVLAGWSLVLGKLSGEDDVVFGQTRAGRPGTVEGADEMVGLFINTVPTRARLPAEGSVRDLLTEIRKQQVDVRPFEHTPLPDIQSWSDLPRNTPLFQSIVVFDRETLATRLRALGGAWETRDAQLRERLGSELTVHVYGEDPMQLVAVADARRFSADRVRAMLGALEAVLHQMAERPDASVGDLSLLPAALRDEVLHRWNDTEHPLPAQRTVHGQFRERVSSAEARPALRDGSVALSYRELDQRSNSLARYLVGLGVEPGTLVGLVAERSVEAIVGMMGILKAGGAYVPLDPGFPQDRLAFMIEDSGVEILLSSRARLADLPEHGARIVHLDADGRAFREDDAPLELRGGPEDLAYVMYTSGSTGRPKGVAVEHRNVTAFFTAMDQHLGTDPGVWLSVTTLSFDISVLELLWTLTRGFEVVLYDDERSAPAPVETPSKASAKSTRSIDFSLFYFSADEGADPGQKYQLLMEGARFADRNGFKAVWTPERHFHAFGGLYPNPAVTGAAVAAITEHVEIRSGSVVLPLHHPARVAEEWAVVDNISGGRVGVSFASGWQSDDFCLRPDNYEDRKEYLYEAIETVRKLWRGETLQFPGPKGDVAVRTLPRPIQDELPIWVTTAGSVESFESAGKIGANILTHLLGQSVEDITEKIQVYREAREKAGHEGPGTVSLMLHTFVGGDDADVRERVREPMKAYLKTAVGLMKNFHQAWEIYKDRSRQKDRAEGGFGSLSDEDMDSLLDFAFERYYETSGLFGSVDRCMERIEQLREAGVDDIACLVDFGVDTATTLAHLDQLAELRTRVKQLETESGSAEDGLPVGFAAQVKSAGVTHLQATPSRMRMFLADPEAKEALGRLQAVLVGGEAFPGPMADELLRAGPNRLLNVYGPTETTIWSSIREVQPEDAEEAVVPIGRPLANERLYVVDGNANPVPPGVPGELWIGGAGVVRGYLDRPELTADRFLPDPFLPDSDARVYRTGDLVRQRDDGVVDFMGRIDHQVKIRGHRIELGEIDAVLVGHSGVESAVTVVQERGPSDVRLVSYYVPTRPGDASEDELREQLARSLPDVMVPSMLVPIDEMPMTPNGKVDRKALPEPSAARAGSRPAAPAATPRNELERRIAAIWMEELGVQNLSIDENFFDAGGHSLLAVQVQSRLQTELERRIPLTDLFRFSTVRGLAEHLGADEKESAAEQGLDRAAMRRRARGGRPSSGGTTS